MNFVVVAVVVGVIVVDVVGVIVVVVKNALKK